MYFFDRYNMGVESNLTGEISYPAKMIALTFDDGPSPRYTELLLDILKQQGVVSPSSIGPAFSGRWT